MADTNSDGEYPTTIGADARFKGELEFDKGVRLLGRFEGSISTKGRLHVASGAKLNAEVQAGDIQVDGEVRGNLHATGKVHLKSSAKLEGDLRTARLEVAEGAIFIGKCMVGPQEGGKGTATGSSVPAATGRLEPMGKKAGPAQALGVAKS